MLKAFSDFLGDKKYISGDKPSRVRWQQENDLSDDTLSVRRRCLRPHRLSILHAVGKRRDRLPAQRQRIRKRQSEFQYFRHLFTNTFPDLQNYLERIKNEFYPDWEEVTTQMKMNADDK